MSTIKPGPKAWTLRFKLHKTTALLYVEPNQSLTAVKTELLAALRETHPILHVQGQSTMLQLPEHIDDIELAKMIELDDKTILWDSIDLDDETNGGTVSRKGKGKATAGRDGGESKETVQSVGLTDGSVVAVRFANSAIEQNGHINGAFDDWDVVMPTQDAAEDPAEIVH